VESFGQASLQFGLAHLHIIGISFIDMTWQLWEEFWDTFKHFTNRRIICINWGYK